MLIFGHLGIGLQLSKPFIQNNKNNFDLKWFFLGCLLPDIIDKSTFYLTKLYLGYPHALLPGTRTLGHTFIFSFFFFILYKKSKKFAHVFFPLMIGIISHIFLDHIGDTIAVTFFSSSLPAGTTVNTSEVLQGVFWPFLGFHFAETAYTDLGDHFKRASLPHLWISEILGFLALTINFKFIKQNRRIFKKD